MTAFTRTSLPRWCVHAVQNNFTVDALRFYVIAERGPWATRHSSDYIGTYRLRMQRPAGDAESRKYGGENEDTKRKTGYNNLLTRKEHAQNSDFRPRYPIRSSESYKWDRKKTQEKENWKTYYLWE